MDKKRAFKQHWQERYVNKAMERIGLPITQQYYNSQGIVKSNSAIFEVDVWIYKLIDYEKVFYSNGAVDWSTIMQNK